jgi:predicted Zn-dependent protease
LRLEIEMVRVVARLILLLVLALAGLPSALAQHSLQQPSIERAAELIQDNQLAEADQTLDQILKRRPNDAAALNLRGTIRAQQGKLSEAEALFQRAARLDSRMFAVRMNLAHLYLLKGEVQKTILELKAALRIEPANTVATAKLADLLLAENQIDDCITFVEHAKQLRSVSATSLITLGDAYLRKRNADKAEENYKQAWDNQNDLTDAVLGLAQVAQLRGQTEIAAQYLARSKTLVADSPATLYRFALVALGVGNPEEANAALLEAVKLQPNDAAYFLLLGTTWLQKPDLVEAEKAFRRCLELQPNRPPCQMSLGYALLLQKQYSEAKAWLEKSAVGDSHTAETFYYLGLIAQQQNEDEKAIQLFNKALELVPSFGHALVALGSTYLKLKNYSAALAALQAGVKLIPDDSKAHYNLAVLYARLKDQQRAQEELSIVEKLKGKSRQPKGPETDISEPKPPQQ